MKRILTLGFVLLVVQTGWSQFAFDIAMGPQIAKMERHENRSVYLLYAPSVRFLAGPIYLKAGLRKSIPREITGPDYYGDTRTGTFSETGIVAGIGFTFNQPTSRTRPYFMFEYVKITAATGPESYETNQARFGAGFQFDLRKGFMLFNETTYNSNSYNSAYEDSFSIEVGIRYFLNM